MASTQVRDIRLNNGVQIPQLGFGIWEVERDQTQRLVEHAIEVGYRHIDGAAAYGNERELGQAIAATSVPREELFITTKLWNADQGYDSTLKAFETSMGKLGLNYLDLYLIHWPMPAEGRYAETWRAFEQILGDGRVRAIGVSNFRIEDLERLLRDFDVVPAVNQIELHPRFQQTDLRAFHREHGIATEAWSPLGHGELLSDSTINAIADAHGVSPAQVLIRWSLDEGNILFPKASSPERISQNFDVFGFSLTQDDIARIDALDSPDGRTGGDPATVGA